MVAGRSKPGSETGPCSESFSATPRPGSSSPRTRLHQRGPGGGGARFHRFQGQLPDHHFAFGAHLSAGELELGIEVPGPGADEHVEVAACVLAQPGEVEVPEAQAGARIETAACRAYRAQHLEPGAGIDRAPDLEAGGLARIQGVDAADPEAIGLHLDLKGRIDAAVDEHRAIVAPAGEHPDLQREAPLPRASRGASRAAPILPIRPLPAWRRSLPG